ncbi:LOW QUALITY PROTEIN: hypothetical protein MXB_434 [Myxobolus squamalis]|nr:LOW QUALITY PROTEIN: hypothetical protein MXB_434 [Myxobolus squamalis]
MFVISIIASLLIDGPNCPFYASLIEPHIGLFPDVGVEKQCSFHRYIDYTKYRIFAIGLAGIGESDIENVEIIIQRTFEKVIKEGFDKQHVNDLIDTLELKFKHHTPDRGLDFVLVRLDVRGLVGLES